MDLFLSSLQEYFRVQCELKAIECMQLQLRIPCASSTVLHSAPTQFSITNMSRRKHSRIIMSVTIRCIDSANYHGCPANIVQHASDNVDMHMQDKCMAAIKPG